MPDNQPSQDRLTDLRQRWQEKPTSQVFFQLAEEYRRHGQVDEALKVLEQGIRNHPGYVSAQVLLARCRLELGDAAAASEILEGVVEQDATHMVANKLLVEAYLQIGQPGRARERLEFYRLLNDRDPEIGELRQRIQEQLEAGEALADAHEETKPMTRRDGGRPSPTDELFPGLFSPADRGRYLERLAAEGLFGGPGEDGRQAAAVATTTAGTKRPPAAEAAAAEPAAVDPRSGDERGQAATATLGELYLRQGYRREAEEIFREVLARDPSSAAARRGLAQLRGHKVSEGLSAGDLLAVLGEAEPKDAGLTERKIFLLKAYLDRLRQGADRRVS